AEGSGRCRASPAGVFPLRFRRQPKLPVRGKFAGCPRLIRELLAERFGFREVHLDDGEVVAFAGRLGLRKLADDPLPLALCHLVFADPESPAVRHLDLILERTAFRFARRAAHDELAGWAPAELVAGDLAFLSRAGAGEVGELLGG